MKAESCHQLNVISDQLWPYATRSRLSLYHVRAKRQSVTRKLQTWCTQHYDCCIRRRLHNDLIILCLHSFYFTWDTQIRFNKIVTEINNLIFITYIIHFSSTRSCLHSFLFYFKHFLMKFRHLLRSVAITLAAIQFFPSVVTIISTALFHVFLYLSILISTRHCLQNIRHWFIIFHSKQTSMSP